MTMDEKTHLICVKCGDRNLFDDDSSMPCVSCLADRIDRKTKERPFVCPVIGGKKFTEEEYEGLLEKQHGLCAGCYRKPSLNRRLDVDHNHRTNTIRGLLCSACNTAIGLAQDKPFILRRLADYLEESMF
jgi:recombination endonuclease VII